MLPNCMHRVGASLVLACLVSLLAMPVRAQALPVFDAHTHYSQSDWSSYSPDAILALLDKTGVRWAFVSSTPDDGTLRLYEKAPDRIVPVLRPSRTRPEWGRSSGFLRRGGGSGHIRGWASRSRPSPGWSTGIPR